MGMWGWMEPFLGRDGGARPQPELFPPQTITGQRKSGGASTEARVDGMKWDHAEQELFGVLIHCLLAKTKLPQSRWLEGHPIALLLPGDFHSVGGDSPWPHTIPEQTHQGGAGRGHGLRASPPASRGFLPPRNPVPFTLSPPQS